MAKETDYKKLWRKGQKDLIQAANKNFALRTIIEAVINFCKGKMKEKDHKALLHLLGR